MSGVLKFEKNGAPLLAWLSFQLVLWMQCDRLQLPQIQPSVVPLVMPYFPTHSDLQYLSQKS